MIYAGLHRYNEEPGFETYAFSDQERNLEDNYIIITKHIYQTVPADKDAHLMIGNNVTKGDAFWQNFSTIDTKEDCQYLHC